MRKITRTWFFAALCLALVVGCRSSSSSKAPPPAPQIVLRSQDDQGKANQYPNLEKQAAESLALALAPKAPIKQVADIVPAGEEVAIQQQNRPINILSISGGGQFGAYSAGIMVGWTATGKRPEFDVVCGVSSGALVAPLVFAGPKWDPLLKKVFTLTKTSDLIRQRPVIGVLFYQSLGTTEPFREIIAKEITEECIQDMASAHRQGRRCFINTMNQNTRRSVIWDLGALATSGRPDAGDLIRKLMLASVAIPGIMPAVDFDVEVNGTRYQETHVDGGAACQIFIRIPNHFVQPDPANPGKPWLTNANCYVIGGGKVYCDPIEGKPGVLKRTKSAVSATLYALYRADLWKTFTICQATGMKFQHTAVPQETVMMENSMTFDPKTMTQLFELGYDLISCGEAWRTTLPGTNPEDEELPRAGLKFTLPKE
ncbi:MAG: patatin-like phospholipase family protein [Fimbriiglobus sp.]